MHVRNAVKPPEPIVDAVHLDTRGTPAARLIGDETLQHHERSDAVERRAERLVAREFGCERFTEETGRQHHDIGAAETLQHEIPEAAADRIADEERAGKNGHGCRDAQHHGDVRPPVVREAAKDQAGLAHPHVSKCNHEDTKTRRRHDEQPNVQGLSSFVIFVAFVLTSPTALTYLTHPTYL